MNKTESVRHLLRSIRVVLFLLSSVLCLTSLANSQGNITRYVYDNNGRLKAIVSSSGDANIYDYDAAGNFTNIRQVPPNFLELFDFFPKAGVFGDQITFVGVGFGAGVTSVLFNGTSAQVLYFDPTRVVAVVPTGATTGPVTIVTPGGAVVTSEPFVLKGVIITPLAVQLLPGESQQFSATVFTIDPDTSVNWSVNGILGGSSTLGTITNSGLYTAPSLPSTVSVRATSNSDPTLFADATVSLRSINGLRYPVSAGVLVQRDVAAQTPPPSYGSVSSGVLVRRDQTVSTDPGLFGPVSSGVLVRRDDLVVAETRSFAPVSSGVLVNRLVTQTGVPDSYEPVSSGVLVQRDPPATSTADRNSAFSQGVLVNRQSSTQNDADSYGPASQGVLVNRILSAVPTQNQFAPVSNGVLVNRLVPASQDTTSFGPVSSGVLVQRDVAGSTVPDSWFVSSSGILVTNGPIITGISPNILNRGSTGTVTITGLNLSGATNIVFGLPSGGIDSLIIASNISVNPNGNTMTVTVQVGSVAAVGNRLVVVQTARGQSLVTSPNANLITIQ